MQISVVYPTYNEEGSIESTIQQSLKSLRQLANHFEIILVNDGSTDQTAQIAERLAKENPEIKILHNERNLGIAETLLRGLQAAQFEWVVHNGMDYCFHLEDLSKMVPLLGSADIVVAARNGYAGYPLHRKFISWTNITLLNFLFGVNLRDYNFVQLYKKSVLDSVHPEFRSGGFVVPEILIRANQKGFKIKQIGIDYHAREKGAASGGKLSVVFGSARDVFRFWFRQKFQGAGK